MDMLVYLMKVSVLQKTQRQWVETHTALMCLLHKDLQCFIKQLLLHLTKVHSGVLCEHVVKKNAQVKGLLCGLALGRAT